MGDLEAAPALLALAGTALPVGDIWGVNQQAEDLYPFQLIKGLAGRH